MALIVLIEEINIDLSCQDIVNLFTLSENAKDFGRYVLSPRKDLVVILGNPTSVKEWKDRYFFARCFIELYNGDLLEFVLTRTWGVLGNSLFFMLLTPIILSNLNVLLCFFKKVHEQPFHVCQLLHQSQQAFRS